MGSVAYCSQRKKQASPMSTATPATAVTRRARRFILPSAPTLLFHWSSASVEVEPSLSALGLGSGDAGAEGKVKTSLTTSVGLEKTHEEPSKGFNDTCFCPETNRNLKRV